MVDLLLTAPGLLLAAFFGAMIQRIAGLGFGLAVSGFSLAIYEPFTAVYVSAIIGFGVVTITTAQLWRHMVWPAIWPPLTPIFLFMLLGFALAYWTGGHPVARAAFQMLGLASMGFVLRTYFAPRAAASNAAIAHPWVGGSLTGFLSGTVGAPGPTITPYFFSRGIVGAAFVASITPVFVVTSATRIAIGSGGGLSAQDFYIALLGAALAICGVLVGARIAPKVSIAAQRRLIITLILLAALRLCYALVTDLWAYTAA